MKHDAHMDALIAALATTAQEMTSTSTDAVVVLAGATLHLTRRLRLPDSVGSDAIAGLALVNPADPEPPYG